MEEYTDLDWSSYYEERYLRDIDFFNDNPDEDVAVRFAEHQEVFLNPAATHTVLFKLHDERMVHAFVTNFDENDNNIHEIKGIINKIYKDLGSTLFSFILAVRAANYLVTAEEGSLEIFCDDEAEDGTGFSYRMGPREDNRLGYAINAPSFLAFTEDPPEILNDSMEVEILKAQIAILNLRIDAYKGLLRAPF